MKYNFKYKTTALDLWQLSMYGIYGSMLGLCNIIFTVAMILLTVKFWVNENNFIKILLIIAICLFTIIQPLAIYYRARKRVLQNSNDMEISFDDQGIHVKIENQTSDVKWNHVKGVIKRPSMIVVLSTNKHGFILTNKVLEKNKKAFYEDVISKIQK